mgnify:CR=1 FL=1
MSGVKITPNLFKKNPLYFGNKMPEIPDITTGNAGAYRHPVYRKQRSTFLHQFFTSIVLHQIFAFFTALF